MSIGVLLADDQALVRAGFRMILESEPDIEVVGEAANGEQATAAARRLRPDVVLMDIQMPGEDGLHATRRITDSPELNSRVVILTTFERDEYVFEALQVDRPAAVAAGVLASYCGAARMLGTTRTELDAPERTRLLLRSRLGRVLRAHAAVPALVVTAAATIAAAGCAVAGVEDLAAAPFAVAAALVVTCCAALSARRRGRLPLSVLSTAVATDPAGGAAALMAWLAWWPAAAAVLAGVPLLLASEGAVALAAGWTVVAVAALVRVLDRDPVEL